MALREEYALPSKLGKITSTGIAHGSSPPSGIIGDDKPH